MKVNENTCLIGSKVILLPYDTHHVLKYHEWMSSSELQQLTASEPLSLEEEYSMQKKWREDDDKCTFIILDMNLYTASSQDEEKGREIEAMVGDVNLFLNDTERKSTAEIEIMIAESCARGQGLGKEALLTMMRYGIEVLGLTEITAKIGFSNTPSLSMFNKLGFAEKSRSEVFEEVTLQLDVTDSVRELITQGTSGYRQCDRNQTSSHVL